MGRRRSARESECAPPGSLADAGAGLHGIIMGVIMGYGEAESIESETERGQLVGARLDRVRR